MCFDFLLFKFTILGQHVVECSGFLAAEYMYKLPNRLANYPLELKLRFGAASDTSIQEMIV